MALIVQTMTFGHDMLIKMIIYASPDNASCTEIISGIVKRYRGKHISFKRLICIIKKYKFIYVDSWTEHTCYTNVLHLSILTFVISVCDFEWVS